MNTAASRLPPVPVGVVWARRAGLLVGLALICLGAVGLTGEETGFNSFKAAYFIVYGGLLLIPSARLGPEKVWRGYFALLCLASTGFVFVLVASVMFDYMAAAERGERLGVPGFEGTLIFLALMQVPAALFARRPDLLD